MKLRIRYACPALLAAGTIVAGLALAEEKAAPEAPLDQTEILKKMEAAGKPGAKHKALDPLAGEWTAEVKSWMEPGAPPTVSEATSTAQWIFDGRFVKEEFQGEMLGIPFTGISLIGYDNQKEKYNLLWIDDKSTTIFTSLGTASEDGAVITFNGEIDCPMTGQKDVPIKHILRIVSDDKHVLEMHDPRMGEKTKAMEITYTRK